MIKILITTQFLDNLDDLEDSAEEREANQKASNWLIEPLELNIYVSKTKKYFSSKTIEVFAKTHHRHPGIILGRLQYEKLVPHKNLRALLVKVSPLLEPWID